MQKIIVVSDIPTFGKVIRASVEDRDIAVQEVTSGPELLAVVAGTPPDLVVSDMQVGNMGGMAICLEIRLEESYGNLPHIPVLLVVDRRADVFLARRSHAEGWLVKPLDPLRTRRAVHELLDGKDFHDRHLEPVPLVTPV
ncbi:MAG: response regulator [Actinobacteria bacterium]|nr:response regulator [Actinomycetota bacterium]MCL5445809.1 response regulator [Actinomycetota bacterium]